jgi:hypothetical protein
LAHPRLQVLQPNIIPLSYLLFCYFSFQFLGYSQKLQLMKASSLLWNQ